MHLLTESSLLNPISTCFRNSAYCANVNNCGCSEHHITPDPYDSSFSMHCQKAYIKVHQKTNWRTQPLDIIWFHEFFWQMKINFSNKKKNNWLTSKLLKSFLPKSHAFCFFFLSYMNNQQSVPKFNSSVWPGPTEKTVSLFCSTSIRLWDKDQLVRANVQP